MKSNSQLQKDHYQRIHDEYQKHYFDATSMKYRETYFFDEMFKNVNLDNMVVADLAGGGGANSLSISARFLNVKTIGFDISAKACEEYRLCTKQNAYEFDLTSGNYNANELFDAAVIIGGVHHCSQDLKATFLTISKMLKPGGSLFMCEPNAYCVLERLRKVWYKNDKYFEENTEEALYPDNILSQASDYFVGIEIKYLGGPAYFVILNSLILRIPFWMKKYIAPIFMFLEKIYNKLPGKSPYPFFIAHWKRKESI